MKAGKQNSALVLVGLASVIATAMIATTEQAAGQCVDLVQDCGGKADNHTDNAQAFAVCQHLASQRSGCITVPAGLFRTSQVALNTSHVELRVSNDAVFLPWIGIANMSGLFVVGNREPKSADYVQNVSIHGEAPGHFTVDVSIAQFAPWHVRAFVYAGGIRNVLLANMQCKLANPVTNALTPYRSEVCCIAPLYRSFGGVRLNPQYGVFHNLSCIGCTWGYGLLQVRSGEKISAQNLYSEGGVTLRLETGDGPGGYVGDIVGQNIACKNGQGALFSACSRKWRVFT